MAVLESAWRHPDTWAPFEIGIQVLRWNLDLYIEIANWFNKNSNAALRFYNIHWWYLALNTYAALVKLKLVIEWENVEFEKRRRVWKVTVKNQEWELTIEYDKKTKKMKMSIRQLKRNWCDPCDKNAYIEFSEETTWKTDELTVFVRKKVIDCLAFVQYEMKKDRKEDKRIY
ncbi:MAG: hypothetical protein ACD_3C00035G0001 [uncultured bacterium (gcode 4)]|uniref:Uncharacterized protein n=1 Tax=uncultured bacterium (gcode 4) TaxID=1234023 RepID=K2FC96_9BACT|nr:MAG: hypothetical protein ACD_3C00035G0001 [uncultured bacterium (gcode 4)]